MNKKFIIAAVVVGALILGVILGRFSLGSESKKPLYWIDPMEPLVHYSAPGKSHMGMELIPVYAENAGVGDESIVRISPTVINNLGVRTATVEQGALNRLIQTVGYVTPNENEMGHVHTYANGWVRNLFVRAVGEQVYRHQAVLQLYSPTLISAQGEYLIALESKNKDLIDASYKKLQTLHIPEEQIKQLKNTHKVNQLIDVFPHQDGIVMNLNIREGMYVTPDTEMMTIVDLSTIWIIAEVFEQEANSVKIGEKAVAKFTAFPGKSWDGQVEYIYPQLDAITRTLKVRFRFANPQALLKPNMYATISLHVDPKLNVLSIPTEALIRSSEGDRVVVSLGDGRFQVRKLTIGIESDGRVEVLSGLKLGEAIVVSGQFLIDSESNLKADFERLDNK